MKVLFLQDVEHVATAGDIKEVKDGFARNFLLPKKIAVAATKSNLQQLEAQRKAIAKRKAEEEARTAALADQLQGLTVTLHPRVGQNGRLYGSITSGDIAEALSAQVGQPVDKRKIELDEAIRQIGEHEVPIRLSKDHTATVKVLIEAAGAAS